MKNTQSSEKRKALKAFNKVIFSISLVLFTAFSLMGNSFNPTEWHTAGRIWYSVLNVCLYAVWMQRNLKALYQLKRANRIGLIWSGLGVVSYFSHSMVFNSFYYYEWNQEGRILFILAGFLGLLFWIISTWADETIERIN